MNINRDNYEEYFLLYADNELTDSEKVEVIMFLKDNKDLEEEFRLIHYTISKPDASIHLSDKSFLLKSNTVSVNEKNYEEIFVLYHDNELTEKERLDTEEFLSLHKELKNEFDLIGLARLTPENSIIFPGKKILYRKEKSDKVVRVIFWRILAAAVFIGFGLWITNLYFQKNTGIPKAIVHSDIPKKSLPKTEPKEIDEKKTTEVVAQSSGSSNQNSIKGSNYKKRLIVNVIKKDKQVFSNNDLVVKTLIEPQKSKEEIINNQLPVKANDEIIAAEQKLKKLGSNEISSGNNIASLKESVQNTVQKNEGKSESDTYAKTASYIADADNKNENYVFYDITTTQFKKTKVGGFLKKVKRVIERTNPVARLLSGNDRQVASKS